MYYIVQWSPVWKANTSWRLLFILVFAPYPGWRAVALYSDEEHLLCFSDGEYFALYSEKIMGSILLFILMESIFALWILVHFGAGRWSQRMIFGTLTSQNEELVTCLYWNIRVKSIYITRGTPSSLFWNFLLWNFFKRGSAVLCYIVLHYILSFCIYYFVYIILLTGLWFPWKSVENWSVAIDFVEGNRFFLFQIFVQINYI